ncbi:hypothetical protein M413DRAFT_445725 [Hebeloma cylindrosporum]|uniref:Uncharacterized protein n=1 Tax=Hebeloma cylindrosporum TaxID=76867 RepID=A0A0C2YIP7_HEBCY|nr:hypothetical protein M413DRAFT_445725 [Hebeloma cylindrosporum h7]
MSSTTLSFLTLLLLCSTPTIVDSLQLDSPSSSSWHPWRRNLRRSTTARTVPPQGYYTPTDAGGSMLTQIPITYPMGQGEPLNAIVSGNSDERVLQDSEANGGLRNYFLSFGFSGECLGQHSGSNQAANLGDGNGYRNKTAVIRWNYGDAQLGACKETIQGGNHFRYWVQNGPAGNSGAVFMAVSYELPLDQSHDIIPNGYNLGRDWLVGNITKNFVQTPNVTNSTTFTGTTTWASYTYETNITYVPNLLQNTNDAINHNITVGATTNSVDGLVAVLEVKITGTPPKSISAA